MNMTWEEYSNESPKITLPDIPLYDPRTEIVDLGNGNKITKDTLNQIEDMTYKIFAPENEHLFTKDSAYQAFEHVKVDTQEDAKKHNHYYKDVSGYKYIDVYRVIDLFGVTDPVLQHILKKCLCAGIRGHKNLEKDINDIYDSAKRLVEMYNEDKKIGNKHEII